jgi:hypothetical protein
VTAAQAPMPTSPTIILRRWIFFITQTSEIP